MGGLSSPGWTRRCLGTAFFCALLWLAVSAPRPARAGLAVDLVIADIQGDSLSAEDIRLRLLQDDDGPLRLQGRIARLRLPGLGVHLEDLALECPQLSVDGAGYGCEAATLKGADERLGPQAIKLKLHYQAADDWRLDFSGLRLARGRVSGHFESDGNGWRGELKAHRLQPGRLAALVPALGVPAGWRIDGRIDAGLSLVGEGGALQRLKLSVMGQDLAYSDPDGLQAAEGLALHGDLQGQADAGEWRGQLRATLSAGQLYSDPVFLEVGEQAVTLRSGFHSRDTLGDLELGAARLHWPGLLEARVDGRLGLGGAGHRQLVLDLTLPNLESAYPRLLQPLLLGSALDDVAMAGGAGIRLRLDDRGPSMLAVRFDEVHVDDNPGRFGVAGLDGELNWQRQGESPASRLTTRSAHLYSIDLGATAVDFLAQGDRLTLSGPMVVPLLEGEARLQSFALTGLLDGPGIAWQASAELSHLSLMSLSQRLDWPTISGELNGHIPGLSYRQGVMRLGGELSAEALGGEIRITDLTLRDPLGPVPVLEADARLRGLDLEQLTRTFSFGRITGLLDGEVKGLQLVGWQPSRFEARFHSPEGGAGPPRRISQRAVENLTELGNGVAVGLSGTFLRFFEDFAYDRILLVVRLAGQNAELDGMPHPGGGYYLVRGRGLPRIDVVGRNRRVAWRDLVDRLKNIRFEGVQVQH